MLNLQVCDVSFTVLCYVDVFYSCCAVSAVYRASVCYKPDTAQLTDGNELELAKVCFCLCSLLVYGRAVYVVSAAYAVSESVRPSVCLLRS